MPVIFHWTLKTRKRLFYPLEEKHFPWPILDIKHHITQIEAPSVFQPANTVIRIILKKKDLSRKQTHCSCVLLCLICLKWEVICEKEYSMGTCTITTVSASSSLSHICSPMPKHFQTNPKTSIKTQRAKEQPQVGQKTELLSSVPQPFDNVHLRTSGTHQLKSSQPSTLQHAFTRLQSSSRLNQS